jgi:hypothetical protein
MPEAVAVTMPVTPAATAFTCTVKLALADPAGTVTLAGTTILGLLLERLMA